MGIKDVGFGMTVSENNYKDLEWLYELAKHSLRWNLQQLHFTIPFIFINMITI